MLTFVISASDGRDDEDEDDEEEEEETELAFGCTRCTSHQHRTAEQQGADRGFA